MRSLHIIPNGRRFDYFGLVIFVGASGYVALTRQAYSGLAFLIATLPLAVYQYFVQPIRRRKVRVKENDWYHTLELSLKINIVGFIGLIIGGITQEVTPAKDIGLATATIVAITEWTLFVELVSIYLRYYKFLFSRRPISLNNIPQDYTRTLRRIPRAARFARSSRPRKPYRVAGSRSRSTR